MNRINLFFLFFFVFISSPVTIFSQDATVSLNLKSTSIKNVCEEIEKKTDFIFVFPDNVENVLNRKINITADSKKITEILDDILSGTKLSYRIIDKQVVIYEDKTEVVNTSGNSSNSNQQKKTIFGVIHDKAGEAIIGANVAEEGTANGTVTDFDGNFSLQVSENSILKITYLGFMKQDIKVGNESNFNIVLLEDDTALEELVVVGYGTQKKLSVVGAIQNINPGDLQISSRKNISNTLAGKLAGVIAVTRSGGV